MSQQHCLLLVVPVVVVVVVVVVIVVVVVVVVEDKEEWWVNITTINYFSQFYVIILATYTSDIILGYILGFSFGFIL